MSEYYQFKEQDAIDFAHAMNIRARRRGDELNFVKCPYCGNNTSDKEKFAINLRTGQFKCLRASCGAHGNMITLARDFDFQLSDRGANVYYGIDRRYFRKFKKPDKPIVPAQLALSYLAERGISEEVARRYSITSQEKSGENVVVIPFVDADGEIPLIKYRRLDPERIKQFGKEYAEANCKQILFGMFQCDLAVKQLVLTEGQMDSLAVAEAGVPNPVSVPTGALGFTWVPHCWDWLKNFHSIVVFGDFERGKVSLLDEINRRLSGQMQVKYIPAEYYKGCKDANDLLRKYGAEAVRAAIENAVPVPNVRIKDLSEVGYTPMTKKEHFSTGIGRLDELFGGYHFGDLNIITGKRGEGKSTLASQILVRALQAGYGCFAYSGELDNETFAEWFYRQASGPTHINRIQREGMTVPEYSVNEEALTAIRNWIRGRLFVFSSEIITDGKTEQEALIETMKEAITQYGSRVILIDNLMTAMSGDMKTDLFLQQTEFVKTLVGIAKKFDVCIILVAHPRKSNQQLDNDDVSGSANITNLADTIISYSRPKDDHDSDRRVLTVTKNRKNGKIDTKGVSMFYEEKSKRIGMNNRFDWQAGWESSEFQPATENPFEGGET